MGATSAKKKTKRVPASVSTPAKTKAKPAPKSKTKSDAELVRDEAVAMASELEIHFGTLARSMRSSAPTDDLVSHGDLLASAFELVLGGLRSDRYRAFFEVDRSPAANASLKRVFKAYAESAKHGRGPDSK